jgi:hypothetical protein
MLVSDERAEEIREYVDAEDFIAETFEVSLKTSFMIRELLADRAERIQKEQTVIAKIEGMKKEYDDEIKGIPYDLWDFYRVMPGRLLAEILKFICNPKEDIPTPQPNPEADSPTGLTP